MNIHQWATLQRAARRVGLLGIVVSLIGCALVVWMSSIFTGQTWLGSGVVLEFFYQWIPTTGGMMIAFWIVVAVWAHCRPTESAIKAHDEEL